MLQVQVEEEQEKTLNFFFLGERGDEEGREKVNFLLLSGERERESRVSRNGYMEP